MNRHYIQTKIKFYAAISVLLLISACSDKDMSDLNAFIAESKIKHTGQVEPLPIITPYESYSYSVDIQRDPFKASVAMVKSAPQKRRSTSNVRPNDVRNREELERYPLESLVMAGIMNKDGDNWAIIKAPDGGIYWVKKGDYMGENHGKIMKITEAKISLKEIIADGMGGWKERKNDITLSE